MKLVLIHGRDQQGQDPDVLQSDWLAALDRGLQECHLPRPSGLQVEFPFFGDKLAELIRKLEEPILHDVLTRGPGKIDSSITALQAEMLQEMADSPASTISDSDVKAQLQGDVQTRDAQNWGWVIALAKALDTAAWAVPPLIWSLTMWRSIWKISAFASKWTLSSKKPLRGALTLLSRIRWVQWSPTTSYALSMLYLTSGCSSRSALRWDSKRSGPGSTWCRLAKCLGAFRPRCGLTLAIPRILWPPIRSTLVTSTSIRPSRIIPMSTTTRPTITASEVISTTPRWQGPSTAL